MVLLLYTLHELLPCIHHFLAINSIEAIGLLQHILDPYKQCVLEEGSDLAKLVLHIESLYP